MVSLKFRAQEWLADRFSFVQYPVQRRPAYGRGPSIKRLPLFDAVLLATVSLIILISSVAFAVFLALFAWHAFIA